MKSTKRITPFVLNGIKLTSGLILGLVFALIITWSHPPQSAQAYAPKNELLVQVEASQGHAAPGNSLAANFLVVVTDDNGDPVTDLEQSDFMVVNHFILPGQTCGFSNHIVSFNNTHNGAYQIQVSPAVSGCTWVEGDYLAQVVINSRGSHGQAPAKLSLRCPGQCAP